ncbi:MAG: SusF/SusE family outer membrane protein [Gillisia sp.]
MKNIINKILFIGAALLTLTSCEKDAELTTLKEVNFSASPDASPQTVILTQESGNEAATTISWPEVVFPIEAPVSYKLQFDVPTDTIGDNAWKNAVTIDAGSDVLSKSFNGSDLNDMVKDLGLESDTEGTLLVRVQATMDRTISSKAVSMIVTPYTTVIPNTKVYLPGAYQGWDPSTADSIPSTATSGVFKGILTFNDENSLEFKVTLQKNWDENYGGDGNGNLVFDSSVNLSVPQPGTYQITIDLNTLKWSAEPYSFGIIGTATPGGWDTDTNMFYDSGEQVWKYVGELQPGALKFRLNDAWTVNYGSRNNDEGIAYLDDPGAHNISTAGVYEVTFKINPEDETMAYYTVEPVSWGIIGDATAGGWDTDTNMTYNSAEGYWEITTELNPGAVKFRRNDSWTINYGPRNNDDGILYLDDPGAYGISEAGTYHITFEVDPANPATAHYTIEKVE